MRQIKAFAAAVESEVAIDALLLTLPPTIPHCPHGQPIFLLYFACLVG